MNESLKADVVIAGGGAAGFFAAVTCAEANPLLRVVLLEKSPELLAKVTISGGGRCNVTHACFDPDALCSFYPRGSRELRGPFHKWQPRDTVAWFEIRGVPIKAESDGRMFPVSNKSTDITGALISEAKRLGVNIWTSCGLKTVRNQEGGGFRLVLSNGSELTCEKLMLATGGNQNSSGFDLAASLGHTIVDPVPSLFTFHVDDPRIAGLPGISVPDAVVSVPGTKLKQTGPLLITHWGLSGPAVLKLSAWGGRILCDLDYTFPLQINWVGGQTTGQVTEALRNFRKQQGARTVTGPSPFGLVSRLWGSLCGAAGIEPEVNWATLTAGQLDALPRELCEGEYRVTGKSLFKEEFVTCGGVKLKEVDFRTLESKVCPGLYFGGELLDIDGVTGGFNLQAAWTTGRLAGLAMADETKEATPGRAAG
ncbi:MAG: NAD(P)/FAD-dependent oxidoreductase [Verrucomicrobia bacterium]|nr:NAD(P)/FAD-dependent oxidoreductase [Verrucomicrobiota bacterium]